MVFDPTLIAVLVRYFLTRCTKLVALGRLDRKISIESSIVFDKVLVLKKKLMDLNYLKCSNIISDLS